MGFQHLSIKLVVAVVILNFVAKSFGEKPCVVWFENTEKQNQGFKECAKQILPKIAKNYPNAKSDEEILSAFDADLRKENPVDDQCLMECVLSHLNITSSDGHLEKTKFLAAFKSNASVTYMEEKFGIWKSCADKAVELAKPDGGFEKNSCKFSAKLLNCAFTDELKLIDKDMLKCWQTS